MKRVVLLPCLLMLLPLCTAFPGGVFDVFTTDDGLSHNQVNALAQDSLGFLWIATPDGLTRFDGYNVVQYRHDFSDSASLPANFVGALHLDRSGNLWVGTFNGLCRYDPRSNTFVRLALDDSSREYSVFAIGEGNDGTLWVASDKGVFSLFPHNTVFVPITNAEGRPLIARVRCITADPWTGKIWFGLLSGGLLVCDPVTRKVYGFSGVTPDEILLSRGVVTSIVPDSAIHGKRIIHVSTANSGLFQLQIVRDSFEVKKVAPSGESRLTGSLSMFRDQRGSLWVGTQNHGVIEMSVANEGMRVVGNYRHDDQVFRSLSGNTVSAILEDHSGNMWFGTQAGLSMMVRRRQAFHAFVPPPALHGKNGQVVGRGVTSLLEDSQGRIWVGTQTGRLYSFDPANQSDAFEETRASKALAIGFGVTALYESRSQPGVLWIGTYGNGVYRWVVGSHSAIRVKQGNGNTSPSSNAINCISEDSRGKLWIGTDAGLNVVDTKTLEIRTFNNAVEGNQLLSNSIWAIAPDVGDSALWIGTVGGWLSRLDLKTNTFQHYTNSSAPPLTNRSVASLYCDSSATLWIGTYSGGLKHLDPSRGRITEFTMRDGLPNNMIVGILPDGRGRWWLSTNNGICRLDPQTGQVHTFEAHDGLQSSQFFRNACLKDRSGRMFFGGPNGVTMFHPDSITLNTTPPRVVLMHVQIPGKQGDLISMVSGPASVELDHTENTLSFEFLGIDFTHAKRNRYAYMLEGADDAWVASGTRRNATYANLSPGSYHFRVKASNNDGVWKENGVTLTVTIMPPLWRTGWFLSAALALVLGFTFAAYRIRVRSQINRRLEIERAREEERESVRIRTARDFHDEMGHRLTRINLLSETASRKLADSSGEVKELLEAIRDNANHLFNGTRDFIWSMDARNDSLFEVAVRLKDFGDELFYKTGMAFQAKGIAEGFSGIRLPMEMRRQVVLIFKEAMTNSARHARCSQVEIDFRVEDRILYIRLSDNGVGFTGKNPDAGTGISNMHSRARKIGGEVAIESSVGNGTILAFKVPIVELKPL